VLFADMLELRRSPRYWRRWAGATSLFLTYADTILGRIGPRGIDAATRIVGFFVAAMGMGLIFHGVTEAIRNYVLGGAHRRGQV
jgi:hypothetical protein